MATTLFAAAVDDPNLMREIASTVTSVTGNANQCTTADAQALASDLMANPAELASLESALSDLATANGLTFDPANARNVTSTQIATFLAAWQAAQHTSNPTSIPMANPEILLFASAAAIYAQGLFGAK